ncbi:MAG: hypothetical protein RLZZ15_1981, partial [Verrucomicrobiota bacterium]
MFSALLPLRRRPSAAPTPVLREFQQWHNRVVLQDWPEAAKALILAAEALVWPFWSMSLAIRRNRKWGPSVRQLTGLGRGRQLIDAVRYAQRHRLHPDDYYQLGFWQHAGAPAEYLICGQMMHIFRALNRGVDVSCLDDKLRFWEFCRDRGLATPPVLLAFDGGKVELLAKKNALAGDLFFKPRCGKRG